MITLLGFGSSARRGAVAWTDRDRVRVAIDVVQPDATVDGNSPAGGADQIFNEEACKHLVTRGMDWALARRCPVSPGMDGPWPAAGHRRNARMFRTHKPTLAVGFISGKVGMPMSSGSAGMLRICREGLRDVPPCPVVVYRDNGIEPHPDIMTAYLQLRRLYAVTRDASLVDPGKALAKHCEMGDPDADELAAGLRFAADGSRWAPWIEAVAATVRAT